MKIGWAKLGGVLGIAYCIAGFLLVFLGWNGAASNDREAAQLPYLVSGGIAGLGLVVLGSALIIAHSSRADRIEMRGAIDELRSAIGAGGSPAARTAGSSAAGSSTSGSSTAQLVVAGPQTYHRESCTMVAGRSDVVAMTAAEAEAGGRTPCRICQPATAE